MSWSAILSNYAQLKDPEKELPSGVLLECNEETITIFDGYEKAKYHFLLLPRDPFPVVEEGEKPIPSALLDSLSTLMRSPSKLKVLKALERQGNKVKTMIQDEMLKEYGFVWDVQIGFHAVESMKHVHLHVISSDMISEKLKNKKHWNSFHPKLGFFLHLDDVITRVENKIWQFKPTPEYEQLLKQDLKSSHPPYKVYKNLPELKRHLVEEFEKRKKVASTKAATREKEKEKVGRDMKSSSNSKKRESSPPSPTRSSGGKDKVQKIE